MRLQQCRCACVCFTLWMLPLRNRAHFKPSFLIFIFLVIYLFHSYIWCRLDLDAALNPSIVGRWEPTVPVGLTAAAAAVLPLSGSLLIWAADRNDVFGIDSELPHRTVTAVYDPKTTRVSQRNVSSTSHNMFCPGLSMDETGRPIITGGSSENATSIYQEIQQIWLQGPTLNVGRGYHSQVTLSDGRIFTIGGSWSGEIGHKDGEIYSAKTSTWTQLPGCLASTMLTNDDRGIFCADNHPWLFAWKNASVFQAGPSKQMNWYGTAGTGSQRAAGFRANDTDAMNGNAVMYDALNGKILTVGGSTSYSGTFGSTSSHIITLQEPFVRPSVVSIAPMKYQRVFANSVILPTGEVFVVGGQSFGVQWTDVNATLIPEMWNPISQAYSPMAQMPIPRTYHSIAALLPDGRVVTGGGGLCWGPCQDPSSNHFDMQIFTPPYLFNSRGAPATRPHIIRISSKYVHVGSFITVTMDTITNVEYFSLVRYGSVTHSTNTDQRRVVLFPTAIEGVLPTFELQVPDETGIMIAGYWMLFAITKEGVPSEAATILIQQI